MKTFALLFVWFVIEAILWTATVIIIVTHKPNDTEEIITRDNKYLQRVKTAAYIIAVLFSLAVGYILKS